MLEHLLSILDRFQDSKVFTELFLEILALDFLKVEISFQAMIEFLFLREELVRDLNDWIIIPETVRILVETQLFRNEAFKVVFHIEHKLPFQKGLLQQYSFDVENVDQVCNAEHESHLRQLLLDNFLFELEFNHHSLRSHFIHVETINLHSLVNV